MIKSILKILLIVFFSFITSITLAQVTIGSTQKPAEGALLDLKEFDASANSRTSSKGILLPRVMLTDLNSLEDISGAGHEGMQVYAGLMVYNMNEIVDPCGNIPLGVYVWNGKRWIWQHGIIEMQTQNTAHLADLQALQVIKNNNTDNTITWAVDLENATYTDPDLRLRFGAGDCGNQRLTSLNCSDNNLFNLDVTPFEELLILDCSTNNISNLNVAENKKMSILECNGNRISRLDVTQNRDLKELACNDNLFANQNDLDLTQNRVLERLECSNNQFHSLNISQNKELVMIDCSNNQLDALDVTQHPNLEFLDCGHNNLSSLNILQSRLLHTLYCNDNKLAQLNITHNPKMEKLNATNNQALSQNNNSAEVCKSTWDIWMGNQNILPARDHRMYRTVNCN